jgi:hypothetical protein
MRAAGDRPDRVQPWSAGTTAATTEPSPALPVEETIGGEAKLRETIERSHELGYPMSLHDNYFDSYSLADSFDRENVT